MITRNIMAYANKDEKSIRVGIATMLRDETAQMGLRMVEQLGVYLTVKEAETLITELKTAVYDYYEESK